MNKILLVLLSLITFTACQQQTEVVTDDQAEKQEANVALVKQFFAHFNNHEWEEMAAIYAEVADFKDPSLGPGIVPQTREETIAKYTALNEIFPDLHDEVIQIYPSGEQHVIVEFVSTGTAPDNSTFELPICTILTLSDGKITKDFTYFDNFDEGEE